MHWQEGWWVGGEGGKIACFYRAVIRWNQYVQHTPALAFGRRGRLFRKKKVLYIAAIEISMFGWRIMVGGQQWNEIHLLHSGFWAEVVALSLFTSRFETDISSECAIWYLSMTCWGSAEPYHQDTFMEERSNHLQQRRLSVACWSFEELPWASHRHRQAELICSIKEMISSNG